MKKILVLCALLISTFSLTAEPIGEERARQIAEEFFAKHATRSTTTPIDLMWAGNSIDEPAASGSALNDALLYIYTRGESDGFVIVAGDSNVAPIIAYSFDTTINTYDMADATRTILDAWCRQVERARMEARPITTKLTSATRSSDELLYNTAQWGQSEPFNREAPVYDGQRSVTGCVATAMAILCYYNRWPAQGVGTTPEYSYTDYYNVERTVAANTLGRKYDYDNMLSDYNDGYTDTQANAVAALMKDMGTSVQMKYHYTSSGTYDVHVVPALINYFDYSRGMMLVWRYSYTDDDWHNLMRENLRNYGPTYYRGQGEPGGHAYVIDGYTGDDYFHFNFGWDGDSNGYYRYPNDQFYEWQAAIINMEPGNDSAPYRDNLLLYQYDHTIEETGDVIAFRGITTDALSYATNVPFNCTYGAIANDGLVDYRGDVALVLCDREGNWKEVLHTHTIESLGAGYVYLPAPTAITISENLAEGDRLRLFFKQQNYDEWTWMRTYPQLPKNVYDDVLVCASAEDIAKRLSFTYSKSNKRIELYPGCPLQLVIKDSKGMTLATDELAPHTNYTLSTESFVSGTYIFEFSLGSKPYTLQLKF